MTDLPSPPPYWCLTHNAEAIEGPLAEQWDECWRQVYDEGSIELCHIVTTSWVDREAMADAPGHPCELGLYLVLTKEEAMRYAYDHADLEAAAEMTARSSRMQWGAAARLIVAAALGVDDV